MQGRLGVERAEYAVGQNQGGRGIAEVDRQVHGQPIDGVYVGVLVRQGLNNAHRSTRELPKSQSRNVFVLDQLEGKASGPYATSGGAKAHDYFLLN